MCDTGRGSARPHPLIPWSVVDIGSALETSDCDSSNLPVKGDSQFAFFFQVTGEQTFWCRDWFCLWLVLADLDNTSQRVLQIAGRVGLPEVQAAVVLLENN